MNILSVDAASRHLLADALDAFAGELREGFRAGETGIEYINGIETAANILRAGQTSVPRKPKEPAPVNACLVCDKPCDPGDEQVRTLNLDVEDNGDRLSSVSAHIACLSGDPDEATLELFELWMNSPQLAPKLMELATRPRGYRRIAPPTLGTRPGDQALPVPNDSTPIQTLVIEDMRKRMELGLQRYGTYLQAHNGRDALQDLYEELMDATVYIRQVIGERDTGRGCPPSPPSTPGKVIQERPVT